jgi:hypothetical protein
MICIIIYLLNTPFDLTINPPKAYAFVKKNVKSATSDLAVALAALSPFIFNVILSSAYLYAAGMYIDQYSRAIRYLAIPVLITAMEFIIQNTIDLCEQALQYLDNPQINLAMLHQAHAYLTPYLRSYASLFPLIQRIATFLADIESDHLVRIEGLARQFTEAGN